MPELDLRQRFQIDRTKKKQASAQSVVQSEIMNPLADSLTGEQLKIQLEQEKKVDVKQRLPLPLELEFSDDDEFEQFSATAKMGCCKLKEVVPNSNLAWANSKKHERWLIIEPPRANII